MRSAQGFTLVELLIVTLIFGVMLMTGYTALLSGQSAWSTTDTQIRLQENLRQTLQRAAKELQESGFDSNNVLQVTISDNTGANGTDILRFSIPLCVCRNSPLDAAGNVADWGAPLTWGKTGCPADFTVETNGKVKICHLPPGNPQNQQSLEVAYAALEAHLAHGDWMGECGSCSGGNKFIEYRINAGGQLLRRVLDDAAALVKEEIFADNIQNFQAALSADQNIVTLTVTVSATTPQKRQITVSRSLNVYLRNRG